MLYRLWSQGPGNKGKEVVKCPCESYPRLRRKMVLREFDMFHVSHFISYHNPFNNLLSEHVHPSCTWMCSITSSYRKGKQESHSFTSWLFSIQLFHSQLWHYENFMSRCLLQRKIELSSLSPTFTSPYQLVHILQNRVLHKTNPEHLCALPNT